MTLSAFMDNNNSNKKKKALKEKLGKNKNNLLKPLFIIGMKYVFKEPSPHANHMVFHV